MHNDITIVLPSARAIRHEQLRIESSTIFLPNYVTMGEFISKLCVVDGFKTIDDDGRVLLLLEASDFKEFSSLQIERNFFTFTKNSSYIFKFFEELSAELYDINELNLSDVYAEYEEHIEILQELYKRYRDLCNERKLLDRIFLPSLYEFNLSYAKSHQAIELHIEGHLTSFEFKLLEEVCKYTSVNLSIKTSEFNQKMQSRFLELGIELEKDYEYLISFNDKKIIQKKEIQNNKKILCESFSESILQVAFIKKKLYDFIKQGHDAKNIALILPNEKMADIIKTFDEKSNLNFAMGESYSKGVIYQKLKATVMYLDQDSKENLHRLHRVGDEAYLKLLSIYKKNSSEVDFISFLNEYKEFFSSKRELRIFEEEIYSFKPLLEHMKEMNVKSVLSLFLQRLSQRTLDDIRGGKITVMGVLETRGVEFDAVIIIDFNDSNVPKRSDKDMFLNTAIREQANLPTMSDRENLQKHYYRTLINSSKEVAISYVESNDSKPSRFLKQLGIKESNSSSELDLASILFDKTEILKKKETPIIREYSFKDVRLSSTRLKTFLTCKRKYYYKYIEFINSHEIPKDMPKEYEIGNAVHSALKELYSKKSSYSNADDLKRDLHIELNAAQGDSELDKYLIKLQKRRMNEFCVNEIKRFSQGWSVHACEESLSVEFSGMSIIGNIDRIDKRGHEIEVLDYKTGSYPLYNKNSFTDATDFQLEFYYLLAGGFGNVEHCGYYDLKESKIVPEAFLEEKLAILQSHIKDLLLVEEVNFEMCEDVKNCLFCEFKTMCERG